MIKKFLYVLTYQEEPCVEGILELRLDLASETINLKVLNGG